MTILKFDGVLDTDNERLLVGGFDVFDAIRRAQFSGPVTVAVGGDSFTGDLYLDEGEPSYSEWTPGEPTVFLVGDHNAYRWLEDRNGRVVTLWIADEPFNTLDPPPVR